MDSHNHQRPAGQSRLVTRLYDRLARLLRQFSPARRAALAEHLQESTDKEPRHGSPS